MVDGAMLLRIEDQTLTVEIYLILGEKQFKARGDIVQKYSEETMVPA